VARFGDLAHYQQEVARTVAAIAGLPSREPQGVRMPGERGRLSLQRRLREGIPVPPAVARELADLPRPGGLALPWAD
jgi:LDH2 family malate/lactate/ureidoglycolate dehydrogenase